MGENIISFILLLLKTTVDSWTTWVWTQIQLCVDIFQHILQCDTIHSWLNPWMQNHRYREPNVKLYVDFRLCRGSVPLTPMLFKGQLYFLLKLPLNLIYKSFQKMPQYFHQNSIIQLISPSSFTIHTKWPITPFKFYLPSKNKVFSTTGDNIK